LPVKEIAIYYDRWEGEGSLCSLQDMDRDFPSFPIDIVLWLAMFAKAKVPKAEGCP
jgi:hypothetical protein